MPGLSSTLKASVAALATICLTTGFALSGAAAAGYPERGRPVTVIVPYPAGGPGDLLSRAVADVLANKTNGTFIIENKPGASQIIGARTVARAAPDGYTLLLGSTTSLAINPSLKESLPYDPVRDFEPISLVVNSPQFLIVRPSFRANSLKDLISLARQSPDKFTFASVGLGTTSHLAGELLNTLAGIRITHVPYAGAAPALNDVVAGHVDMIYTTAVLNMIKSGQVKALAVTSTAPVTAAPEISTVASLGMPIFDMGIWMGFLAPAGTPKEIVDQISSDIRAAVASGDLQQRMGAAGSEYELLSTTPDDFKAFIQGEIPKWEKIIRQVGLPKS